MKETKLPGEISSQECRLDRSGYPGRHSVHRQERVVNMKRNRSESGATGRAIDSRVSLNHAGLKLK